VKTIFVLPMLIGSVMAADMPSRPADKPFVWPVELKYDFMPEQKMIFIDGVVKNREERALPDIEAQYSHKVRVDNLIFTLPGELCETLSACYKADLNQDQKPDYIFVNIKIWNGREAGRADVGVFVSNPQKKYTFNGFDALRFEAAVVNGRVMLVKYDLADDDISCIRQFYTFGIDGKIKLYGAEAFTFKY
jgi:hypothetical protein